MERNESSVERGKRQASSRMAKSPRGLASMAATTPALSCHATSLCATPSASYVATSSLNTCAVNSACSRSFA